jgi:hypothetical protein
MLEKKQDLQEWMNNLDLNLSTIIGKIPLEVLFLEDFNKELKILMI